MPEREVFLCSILDHARYLSPDKIRKLNILGIYIGVAGSFSEGGQPFRPAKIQALPAKIFSCQGGAKFADSVLPC